MIILLFLGEEKKFYYLVKELRGDYLVLGVEIGC
jgi:hypothetical protein